VGEWRVYLLSCNFLCGRLIACCCLHGCVRAEIPDCVVDIYRFDIIRKVCMRDRFEKQAIDMSENRQ
jgi:hypothetical protein